LFYWIIWTGWQKKKPDDLADEWNAILSHCSPDCRFLWRSAAVETDFVDEAQVQYNGKRDVKLGDLLQKHVKLAEDLHVKDRVHTYTSLHIADLVH